MKKSHEPGKSNLPTSTDKSSFRRALLMNALASFLGGGLLGYRATPVRSASPSGVTEEELAPFKKIAKEKGVKLAFIEGKRDQPAKMSEMHLDMDMVRASLQDAIARAKKQGLSAIQVRLERLLSGGTAAQQIDFVLGSGRQYMFPEDVERLAAKAEQDKFHSFGVVCGTFCWLSCICTGQFNQECRERCREIVCTE